MSTTSTAVTAVSAPPRLAEEFFTDRLAFETDPADVWAALSSGSPDFVLVDCRSTAHYRTAHIPGAVSLPHATIDDDRVAGLPDGLVVTYCWGPGCNAATKAARKLAALGRPVKEMIGGIEYWIREGHPTERGREPAA